LRQIATVREPRGNLQQVATFCDNLTALTDAKGHRRPVVEHKGIVERADVFSLVTSARSGVSAVGQTALAVRPMFDVRIVVKKNTDLQGGIG
jgi:hypothetical protein